MGIYVANQVLKLMIQKEHKIAGAKVLVLGITFKENCPDIRNSRVIDVIRELQEFGTDVEVYDPWADSSEVQHEYGISLIDHSRLNIQNYDAVVLAVAHKEFEELDLDMSDQQVLFDIKSLLDPAKVDGRL